jgi:uncharacterized protein DUF4129
MKQVCLIILLVGSGMITGIRSIAQDERKVDTVRYLTDSAISAGADSASNNSTPHSGAAETSQDGEDRNKETAATAPVTLRTIPDSTMHRFKNDDDFAYANDPAYWTKKSDGDNGEAGKSNWLLRTLSAILQSKGFKYFFFLLLAAILGYALYKIMAENNWRIFERSSSKSRPGAGQEEEIAAEDLEGNLRKALQDKDFRMSVRYLFLKSLYLLNDQGMIRLRLQATNREYMDEMKTYPQARSFQYLENAYDHVWYGGFPLTEQQFEWLHQYFQDFYKSLEL